MKIDKNTVVQFHYTLSDATGVLESSHDHEPVLYLHGQPGLIDGLVDAMEGREAGARSSGAVAAGTRQLRSKMQEKSVA